MALGGEPVRRIERVSALVSNGRGPEVVLVRHGATALNAKTTGGGSVEKIRGWADIPLDEEGVRQAHEIAQRLSKDPIDEIYSSDLSRARVTAEAIAKALPRRVRVTVTEKLRPWNLGDYTGKPVSDVVEEMKKLVTNPAVSPPGGEPFDTFRQRALGFLRVLTERARGGSLIVACTHTRVTQAARAWVACGATPDLRIDPNVMEDYDHEIKTGADIVLKPKGSSVVLGTPE